MTVHFIGAGPGAPDLLTLRAKRLIETAEVCLFAGSLVPQEVVAHASSQAEVINSAPLCLDDIECICVRAHRTGRDVARLHSGDLSVWSAMGEQMRRLRRRGVPYTVTPGVPAFAASAAALSAELTLPGMAQSVVLTRTSGRASAMPESERLEEFARSRATLAIHLSIHALGEVVRTLMPHYGPDCPAAVVYRASWPDELVMRATLGTIEERMAPHKIERTALILVGNVLGAADFDESALYKEHYRRRYRSQAMEPPGAADEPNFRARRLPRHKG